MSAVAWGVVVALAGVGASVYWNWLNWNRIKSEPARQKQRELHEQLRTIMKAVEVEIEGLTSALTAGREINEAPPPAVQTANDTCNDIARRLSNRKVAEQFETTGWTLSLLAHNWMWPAWGQTEIDRAAKQPQSGERDTEMRQLTVQLQARRAQLLNMAEKAVTEVKARLQYLDLYERQLIE